MKKLLIAVAALAALSGCQKHDANVAANNLSVAADNFELNRRIVFFNGITDKYMLVIQGKCSKDDTSTDKKLSITCKVAPGQYERHLLGLSDNMSYMIQQLDPAEASTQQYRVVWKPTTVIPDLELR